MRRSYASLVHFQEGWSSLQRHSRAPRHTHRELTLQTGRLEKLQVRITSKMCSKNLQITSDRGSWARWKLKAAKNSGGKSSRRFATRSALVKLSPSRRPKDVVQHKRAKVARI